jgi:hypothetical protein
MFKMFTQLWTALSMWFAAFEKFGGAISHLSTWAEESAGAFADEARMQRAAKMQALQAQLKQGQLAAPQSE